MEIEDYKKIQQIVDVNDMKTDSNPLFIAAVEQNFPKFQKPTKKVRWIEKYTVPDKYVPKTELVETGTLTNDIPLSAIEALAQGLLQGDIRPRLFDKISKAWTLLDSGSVVTCIPKGPNDTMDSSIRLRSVNGGSIATFGTGNISANR